VTDLPTDFSESLADRYRVEREIGQGGMATVFLATDLKHQRPVAIKVLRPELAYSLGPERFLREIEIAARLQHPNILPVYDSGEAAGMLYYVMPFVEGESLRERIVREGALPPGEAIRIAREVADALDYAHRQGIVHRDIKPANILLSQGHAVVADFGIARAVSASATPGLTQVGMAVGSPTYMSPEQALGEQNLDGRTDIFALGVMLFEMLDGKAPFEGATPQAIIAQALSDRRRSLTSDPFGVQPTIERALAREPSDRFATAGEMRAALDGVTTGTRPVATARRPRRAALIAGGVIAAAAIAAFALLPRGYRPDGDPRRSLIVFPFENRTGDGSRDYLEEAAMNLLGLAASHWQDMRVYDDERTASALRRREIDDVSALDFAAAQAIAREAKVGTLVLGDIRMEGDSLAIEAKVHDVRSGDRLATHIVRAAAVTDPRPLFDDLAARILGASGAPPGERPSVLAQTTSSLEAYREYLAGSSALQRLRVDTAGAHLRRAVALDSGFALAYLRLREVAGWGTLGAQIDRRTQRDYVLAAERHSANLPPRLRSLVAFHRAYVDDDYRRARQIAEELIARDSTDVEAWYQLGEAHFHHAAPTYPHPDSLGNLGRALRAFQRALALDSTYMLAYQHIIDALRSCAADAPWVCLADSAAYGAPDELRRLIPEAELARWREDARTAEVTTARGWVSADPANVRARTSLMQVLFSQRRLDEARREIDGLVRAGGEAQAGFFLARIEFLQGRPGVAARVLDSALATTRDTAAMIASSTNVITPGALLAGGGGLLAEGVRLNDALFRALARDFRTGDSVPGPGNLRWSLEDLRFFGEGHARTESGVLPPAEARAGVERVLLRRTAGDSATRRRLVTASGASLVSTYLASRDTTMLALLLSQVDTIQSATWRIADALLALERGDTARARLRVDRHYRQPHPTEFNGEQGLVRTFAWGDLLARLGEHRLALEAYARLDSADQRLEHPGLLVRSYAARGALHQQLGERDQAIEWYERFVAAWEGADPPLQPAVQRARDAIEALRGGPRPVRPSQ
jgi:tRNA A-37 threonylcarbamoyl transferase component Bud32/tetratricopeptide (TPR) repeat protein